MKFLLLILLTFQISSNAFAHFQPYGKCETFFDSLFHRKANPPYKKKVNDFYFTMAAKNVTLNLAQVRQFFDLPPWENHLNIFPAGTNRRLHNMDSLIVIAEILLKTEDPKEITFTNLVTLNKIYQRSFFMFPGNFDHSPESMGFSAFLRTLMKTLRPVLTKDQVIGRLNQYSFYMSTVAADQKALADKTTFAEGGQVKYRPEVFLPPSSSWDSFFDQLNQAKGKYNQTELSKYLGTLFERQITEIYVDTKSKLTNTASSPN